MKKRKLLISSCLLGEVVKYNGSHNKITNEQLNFLEKRFILYPFCPEVEGGLPTPRIPCEIISQNPLKIVNKDNQDKTKEFLNGAKKALELCNKENITIALLKANSPSCSNKKIYDGTFSSTKIDGYGVTTDILIKNGITVFNETQINKFTLLLHN